MDLGSEISIISEEIVRKLDLEYKCTDQWLRIEGLGGKTILSTKRLETVITFEESEKMQPLPIRLNVLDTSEDLTIGSDFLQINEILCDYKGIYNKKSLPSLIADPWRQKQGNDTLADLQAPLYYKKILVDQVKVGTNYTDYESSAYAEIKLGKHYLTEKMLLDTGSPINLINEETYKKITGKKEIRSDKTKCYMSGIVGDPIEIPLKTKQRIKIGERKTKAVFYVMKNLPIPVIVGMKTMANLGGLYVSYSRHMLTNNLDIEIPIFFPRKEKWSFKVRKFYKITRETVQESINKTLKELTKYKKWCSKEKIPWTPRRLTQKQEAEKLSYILTMQENKPDEFEKNIKEMNKDPKRTKKQKNTSSTRSFENVKLSTPEFPVSGKLSNIKPTCKLRIITKIEIPKVLDHRQTVTIPKYFAERFKGQYAIFSRNRDFPDSTIKFADALVTVDKEIGVSILNMSGDGATIPKNTEIGTLTLLEKEDSVHYVADEKQYSEKIKQSFKLDSSVSEEPLTDEEAKEKLEKILAENEWCKAADISDKMTIQQRLKIIQLIQKKEKCFSKGPYDIGKTSLVEFEIPTTTDKPVNSGIRRTPEWQKKILNEMIPEMEKAGIIRRCETSKYNNATVVVKKPNNQGYRICLDLRDLNKISVAMPTPIPDIRECLDTLSKNLLFSSLDMCSAFNQILIKESDKHKTAFIVSGIQYEYEVMTFGHTNSPYVFASLMTQIFGDIAMVKMLIYLDDILIFSEDFDTHLERLYEAFTRLIDANLKLKLKKCAFCYSEVRFLGWIIGKEGYVPNPEKVEIILKEPAPKNVKQVQRFLGMLNYYARGMENMQALAAPISNLVKKSNRSFVWTEECQENFVLLKQTLCNAPVVCYPDFDKEFILSCDASNSSSGAVLKQVDDSGIEKVVGYFSKKFSEREHKYDSPFKEFLAVVQGVRHFRNYLLCKPFKIYTDCAALKYVKNMKLRSLRNERWLLELSQFKYEVYHKPGVKNEDADFLSRLQINEWELDIAKNERSLTFLKEKINVTELQPWREKLNITLNTRPIIELEDLKPHTGEVEMDVNSLYKEISYIITGSTKYFNKLKAKLTEYINKHKRFYRDTLELTESQAEWLHEQLDPMTPGTVEVQAVASLIKTPIITNFQDKPRVFLPATESTATVVPPFGSTIILQVDMNGSFKWSNKSFSNELGETDLDLEEPKEEPVEETGDEQWINEKKADMERNGFYDLPYKNKKRLALKVEMPVEEESGETKVSEDSNEGSETEEVEEFGEGLTEEWRESLRYYKKVIEEVAKATPNLFLRMIYNWLIEWKIEEGKLVKRSSDSFSEEERKEMISWKEWMEKLEEWSKKEKDGTTCGLPPLTTLEKLVEETPVEKILTYVDDVEEPVRCERGSVITLKEEFDLRDIDTDEQETELPSDMTNTNAFEQGKSDTELTPDTDNYYRSYAGTEPQDGSVQQMITIPEIGDIRKLQETDEYCQAWGNVIDNETQNLLSKKHIEKYGDNICRNADGILVYRKRTTRNTRIDENRELIVLPLSLANTMLKLAHDHNGHFGVRKCIQMLELRFFRQKPAIGKLVVDFIEGCLICYNKVGRNIPRKAEVQKMYVPPGRLRAYAIDHISLPTSYSGNTHCLTVSDLYTKYTIICPVPDVTAETTAETLQACVFKYFGLPDMILSDKGTGFEAETMAEVLKLLRIEKRRSTSSHPASNGQCERAHKSIGDLIRIIARDDPKNWDKSVPALQLYYNSSYHRTIEENPGYLLLGMDLQCPIDLLYHRELEGKYCIGLGGPKAKAAELQKYMQLVRQRAMENIEKNTELHRTQANKKRHTRTFEIGNRVLLHVDQRVGGAKKLHLKYADGNQKKLGIYRVVEVKENKVNIVIQKIGTNHTMLVHIDNVIHYDDKLRNEIIEWGTEYEKLISEMEGNKEEAEEETEGPTKVDPFDEILLNM